MDGNTKEQPDYEEFNKLVENHNIDSKTIIIDLIGESLINNIERMNMKIQEQAKCCHSLQHSDCNQVKCTKCGKTYKCYSCSYKCCYCSSAGRKLQVKICEICNNNVEFWVCSDCHSSSCFCGHPCGCTC